MGSRTAIPFARAIGERYWQDEFLMGKQYFASEK